MIFGHNTNVSLGNVKYHVQTEDAGITSALIDTTVFCAGRVLHRRTNNYLDLLPLNADREEALKLRVEEQHRQVIEEIRSGALYLPPPTPAQSSAKQPAAAAASCGEQDECREKCRAACIAVVTGIDKREKLAEREARHFTSAHHRGKYSSQRR